jgi:hypothetical protein
VAADATRKRALEPIAARVLEVRKSLPPPAGRRSRLGYMNVDDFAAAVAEQSGRATRRGTVINWEAAKQEPDQVYREALAALSLGEYMPEDFAIAGAATDRRVEERLDDLEQALEELRTAVSGLEAQLQQSRRGQGGAR